MQAARNSRQCLKYPALKNENSQATNRPSQFETTTDGRKSLTAATRTIGKFETEKRNSEQNYSDRSNQLAETFTI